MKDYYELLKLREEHIENTRKKDIIKVERDIEYALVNHGKNKVVVRYVDNVSEILDSIGIEYIMLKEDYNYSQFIVFPNNFQKKIIKVDKITDKIFLIFFILSFFTFGIFGFKNMIPYLCILVNLFLGISSISIFDFLVDKHSKI